MLLYHHIDIFHEEKKENWMYNHHFVTFEHALLVCPEKHFWVGLQSPCFIDVSDKTLHYACAKGNSACINSFCLCNC